MNAKDERMLWIRNIDALESATGSYLLEAEFASEVLIPGHLEYAGGDIVCGPITTFADSRGLFKYVLRMRMPTYERMRDEPRPEATKGGYVFRPGPVGELLSLISLRLQVRTFLLSTSERFSANGLPLKTEFEPARRQFGPKIDPIVFGESERNFVTHIGPFLDRVKQLPPLRHHRLAVAAYHYARALREIGIDEEMVFVRLVSAVEKLSHDHPLQNDPLGGLGLDQLFRTESLAPQLVEEFAKLLNTRKARARFVALIVENGAAFLEGQPTEPPHTQVTVSKLPSTANAIYNARSAYLHAGDPMYLSRYIPDFPDWHMDPSVGMRMQDRRYTERQKLPRADFFHGLVRHCILGYFGMLEAG